MIMAHSLLTTSTSHNVVVKYFSCDADSLKKEKCIDIMTIDSAFLLAAQIYCIRPFGPLVLNIQRSAIDPPSF